jgi:hypothetical protein
MLSTKSPLQGRELVEWVLANAIGWAIGFGVVETLIPAYNSQLAAFVTMAYTLGATFLGFVQWWTLRRRGPVSSAWVAATTLGFLAGYLAFRLTESSFGGESQAIIVLFSLVAAGVGIGQWLILRRQFTRARWWMPVVLVSWLCGAGMWVVLTRLTLGAVLSNLGAGMASGVVTGYALHWLFSNASTDLPLVLWTRS